MLVYLPVKVELLQDNFRLLIVPVIAHPFVAIIDTEKIMKKTFMQNKCPNSNKDYEVVVS